MRDFKGLGLRVATGCWLAFAWVLLWGNPTSLGTWIAGFGIALVVMVVFPLPRRKVIGTLHLFDAIRLVLYVLGQVTISSVEVAWVSLSPWRKPTAALLVAPMRLESDFVLSLAVNTLNIIPGGIVVRIDERNRQVIMHVFEAGSQKDVEKFYKNIAAIEWRYVRAFEPRENLECLDQARRTTPVAPAVKDEWLVDGAEFETNSEVR